jgi:hypothetical protein
VLCEVGPKCFLWHRDSDSDALQFDTPTKRQIYHSSPRKLHTRIQPPNYLSATNLCIQSPTMPPTLVLIRHAEALHNVASDWSLHDPPLSELGERQCAELQENLKKAKIADEIELIVVSSMRRTLQTASLGLTWLIEEKKIPVLPDAGWQGVYIVTFLCFMFGTCAVSPLVLHLCFILIHLFLSCSLLTGYSYFLLLQNVPLHVDWESSTNLPQKTRTNPATPGPPSQ